MPISLTQEQVYQRLLEPERNKLLTLAINEDIKSILSIGLEIENRYQKELNKDKGEQVGKIALKLIYQVINLAFDEALDPET